MEGFKLKKELENRNQEYYNSLADDVEKLNKTANSPHIMYIITSLRSGNVGEAKADCFNQSDKFDSMPEIQKLLIGKLFEPGEEHPWELTEKFIR